MTNIFVELVWGIDMALGRSDWHYDEIGVAGGWGFRLTIVDVGGGFIGCIQMITRLSIAQK